MVWVDYRNACDMVLHSWIIATMGMVGLADGFVGLIKQSMAKWKKLTYMLMENYLNQCPSGEE